MRSDTSPSRAPLIAWLIVSVGLHISVLLPIMQAAVTGSGKHAVTQAMFEPEAFDDEAPREEQVQLGIDESVTSTMTWIGYKQYQEHLAELGQVEQAAFDPQPTPPRQSTTEQISASVPTQPVEAETQPVEATADGAETVEDVEPQSVAVAGRTLPVNPMELLAAMHELFAVFNEQPSLADMLAQAEHDGPDASNTVAAESSDDAGETSNAAAQAQPQKVTPPQPDPTPPVPPAQSDPTRPVADVADRESDASSIVEVPLSDVKLGKPLAAQGLELKTARPKFTTLQLVTLAPRFNPRAQVSFTRDGRPLDVKIIDSSGNLLIDDAVEASLYRWRASGDDLATLKGDDTIAIEIRIILVNR